jgi:hypothetical protein
MAYDKARNIKLPIIQYVMPPSRNKRPENNVPKKRPPALDI